MGFKTGIVGLPNVGKSTLFNALTAAEIPAENYPFCTIDPNVGIVPVPDPRLGVLTGIVHPEKTIPTTMEFVDIAGLVAGASKGEGLGNKFLANIRETHAIAHVVRCFEDDDVTHVTGRINPLDDTDSTLVLGLETVCNDSATYDDAYHLARYRQAWVYSYEYDYWFKPKVGMVRIHEFLSWTGPVGSSEATRDLIARHFFQVSGTYGQ